MIPESHFRRRPKEEEVIRRRTSSTICPFCDMSILPRELGKSEDMMQVAVRRISKPLQGYRLRQETSYSFGRAVPSRLRLD
ncbi:Hypothetical predicted protein [Octopus vulgaris]|uniref:Uncharacterized protein n=1 Tax=Octopus vulgaris TaxID=6645 RepID=A0AA36BIY3_OCTVU|nr:Hypothetical predicted protein [Octopus vulgaris]